MNTIIEAKIDLLFKTLLDIPGYKTWWVPSPAIDNDRQSFHFYPLPFIRIKVRYDNHEWGKNVSYSYVKGPFRGKAIWQVTQDKDSGKLKLAYSVTLNPTNSFFKIISRTPRFRQKHSNDIIRLVKSLEKEVYRRRFDEN